jgi:lysophospholipase L1-like esterase
MVAACAWAAWPKREVVLDTHRITRQFVIRSTLARFDDAVVVLGDSIVEASTLPRALCGQPIINAGLGGASTTSHLDKLLAEALSGKQAAAVVVSLGSNDAAISDNVEQYSSNYRALLANLAALTPRIAIAAIPPPEPGLEEAKKVRDAVIDKYNAVLPALAQQAHAGFIPLPPMPAQHTIDGIHLNAAGYEVWDKAMMGGIEAALCR